jgi:hypothetical protein
VTDLPQGPADILVLIVARGCVEQFSGRFTHFAASAVSQGRGVGRQTQQRVEKMGPLTQGLSHQ